MSNKLKEKLKKLYFEKFGISLNDEETTEMATDLVNLVQVLVKPQKQTSSSQERREYATVTVSR